MTAPGRRYAELGLALAIALASGAAPAVAEREAWEVVLAAQLESERGCRLAKVLQVSDVELGGKLSKSGKIECIDGRQFDFSRPSPQVKFEIRLCEPAVC